MKTVRSTILLALALLPMSAFENSDAATKDDEKAVGALDTEYQAAVKRNDEGAMARILADDFILVTGRGETFSKEDLLKEARDKVRTYERQEDSRHKVRVWGDTAVITALLWAKGTEAGKPFDYQLWFSDIYIRTAQGWRYRFAQSSIPLPREK